MKKYIIRVFTDKGLFESFPKTEATILDFVVLLKFLNHKQFSITVLNENNNSWEDCTKEFITN